MRILMLGWELPPTISGGLGVACAGLGQALARAGHDVLFLMPQEPGGPIAGGMRPVRVPMPPGPVAGGYALPYPGEAGTLFSAYGPYAVWNADRSANTPTPGCYSPRAVPDWAKWVTAAFADSAQRVADRFEFDLIHCHDWLTFPAGLAIQRRCGKPLAIQIHSLETDRNAAFPNAAIREIEAVGIEAANAVIAVSRYCRDRIVREFGVPANRVEIVHNGVQSARFSRTAGMESRSAAPTVLFLGRVTRQKAPAVFVRAAVQVRNAVPDVRFVVAGSGDRLDAVRRSVDDLGIADAFTFMGAVPWADVPALFGSVDVLAMPSISEPFGLVALEAAAAGVAVVLSEAAGVREILPAAPTVAPFDAVGLAQRVIEMLHDPDLLNRSRAANRKAARRATWDVAATRLETVYSALCPATAD